jgi:hypothetical protein
MQFISFAGRSFTLGCDDHPTTDATNMWVRDTDGTLRKRLARIHHTDVSYASLLLYMAQRGQKLYVNSDFGTSDDTFTRHATRLAWL